jgi:hypothetical protein
MPPITGGKPKPILVTGGIAMIDPVVYHPRLWHARQPRPPRHNEKTRRNGGLDGV